MSEKEIELREELARTMADIDADLAAVDQIMPQRPAVLENSSSSPIGNLCTIVARGLKESSKRALDEMPTDLKKDPQFANILFMAVEQGMSDVAQKTAHYPGAIEGLPAALCLLQTNQSLKYDWAAKEEHAKTYSAFIEVLADPSAQFSFSPDALQALQSALIFMVKREETSNLEKLMSSSFIDKVDLNALLMVSLEYKLSKLAVVFIETGATALPKALAYAQSFYHVSRYNWGVIGYEGVRKKLVTGIAEADASTYSVEEKKQLLQVLKTLLESQNARARGEFKVLIQNKTIPQVVSCNALMHVALNNVQGEAMCLLATAGATNIAYTLCKMQEGAKMGKMTPSVSVMLSYTPVVGDWLNPLDEKAWKDNNFSYDKVYSTLVANLVAEKATLPEKERESLVSAMLHMISQNEIEVEMLLGSHNGEMLTKSQLGQLWDTLGASQLDRVRVIVGDMMGQSAAKHIAAVGHSLPAKLKLADKFHSKLYETFSGNFDAMLKDDEQRSDFLVALGFLIEVSPEKAVGFLNQKKCEQLQPVELDRMLLVAAEYENSEAMLCLLKIGYRNNCPQALVKVQKWKTDGYAAVRDVLIDTIAKVGVVDIDKEKKYITKAACAMVQKNEKAIMISFFKIDSARAAMSVEAVMEEALDQRKADYAAVIIEAEPKSVMAYLARILAVPVAMEWSSGSLLELCQLCMKKAKEQDFELSETEQVNFVSSMVNFAKPTKAGESDIQSVVVDEFFSDNDLMAKVRLPLFLEALRQNYVLLARRLARPIFDKQDLGMIFELIRGLQGEILAGNIKGKPEEYHDELISISLSSPLYAEALAPAAVVALKEIIDFLIKERPEQANAALQLSHIKNYIADGYVLVKAVEVENFDLAVTYMSAMSSGQQFSVENTQSVLQAFEISLNVSKSNQSTKSTSMDSHKKMRRMLANLYALGDCLKVKLDDSVSKLGLVIQGAIQVGDEESVTKLLDVAIDQGGVFDNNKLTQFLRWAFSFKNLPVAQYLESKGVRLNVVELNTHLKSVIEEPSISSQDRQSFNRSGFVQHVLDLAGDEALNLNQAIFSDPDYHDLLTYSVRKGYLDVVEKLLGYAESKHLKLDWAGACKAEVARRSQNSMFRTAMKPLPNDIFDRLCALRDGVEVEVQLAEPAVYDRIVDDESPRKVRMGSAINDDG